MKKVLLCIAVGLLASAGLATYFVHGMNAESIAGGITKDGNDRTIVLDKITPLNIDGGVGTLTIGNIGFYAPGCSSLSGGVATLTEGKLYIYCINGPKYGTNSNFISGFGSSTINV